MGFLFFILSLFSFEFQNDSIASQAHIYKDKSLIWSDNKFVECKNGCLYSKANENISIQALYLIRKIRNLKELENTGSPFLRDELRGFCTSSNENSSDCLKRYIFLAKDQLNKMKAAIVRNADSELKFSHKGEKNPVEHVDVPIAFISKEEQQELKAQVPIFSTFKELEKQYTEESIRLKRSVSDNYIRAVADEKRYKPSKDDYVKYEPIDPKNPDSGTRIKTKPDGSPEYDEVKYKKALADYDAQKNLGKDLKAIREGQDFKDLNKKLTDRKREKVITTSDVDEDSYRDAWNLVIGHSNDFVNGKKGGSSSNKNKAGAVGRGKNGKPAAPQTNVSSLNLPANLANGSASGTPANNSGQNSGQAGAPQSASQANQPQQAQNQSRKPSGSNIDPDAEREASRKIAPSKNPGDNKSVLFTPSQLEDVIGKL